MKLNYKKMFFIFYGYSILFVAPFIDASTQKKPWTFCVYMAARNDLHPFSKTNLRQMLDIGSTDNINIVVNLDEPGKTGTQRFFIEKHNLLLLSQNSNSDDSGKPSNLVDFCRWAFTAFPAENYALILWDHGTGVIDPYFGRNLGAASLFNFNEWGQDPPTHCKLLLDTIQARKKELPERGVCFDDTYKNYLSNQDLQAALRIISKDILQGKKLNILGFDACLMSDIAIANIAKPYVDIMVSSQNVELGPGWNYRLVLSPFLEKTIIPHDFAKHMVHSYGRAYHFIIGDYTQSALDLSKLSELEHTVNDISILLIEALRTQQDKSVKDAIRISKSRRLCTAFDEPSYLDLHHLFLNLSKNISLLQLQSANQSHILQEALLTKLQEGMELIKQVVIANNTGTKLPNAEGISIYFPEARIHSSYPRIPFASENTWLKFIQQYLTS